MSNTDTDQKDSPHIIVFGNTKNGAGKTTAAMHTAIALMRLGYEVGTIDLDIHRATLSLYLKNRWQTTQSLEQPIPSPLHIALEERDNDESAERKKEDYNFFVTAIAELGSNCDFVIVDTDDCNTYRDCLAHSYADTIITPLPNSMEGLELIVHLDSKTHKVVRPSPYTQMIKEMKREKQNREGGNINWIIMRNRITPIQPQKGKKVKEGQEEKELEAMDTVINKISTMYGFEVLTGFNERPLIKELFKDGLTLLDLKESKEGGLDLSQIAARQEARRIIHIIGPEKLKGHRKPPESFSLI